MADSLVLNLNAIFPFKKFVANRYIIPLESLPEESQISKIALALVLLSLY